MCYFNPGAREQGDESWSVSFISNNLAERLRRVKRSCSKLEACRRFRSALARSQRVSPLRSRASARSSGQFEVAASSLRGVRILGSPAATRWPAMLFNACTSWSVGNHLRCGSAAARCTAGSPVPPAISSTAQFGEETVTGWPGLVHGTASLMAMLGLAPALDGDCRNAQVTSARALMRCRREWRR
jgi:hypothetical protein